MSSGILATSPPPNYRCGHPAGHPKLLQLETPLIPYTYAITKVMHQFVANIVRYIPNIYH